MSLTSAQSVMPAVNTGSGPCDTLLGWSASVPSVAAVAPWYRANYGVPGSQFMDRATLDQRVAALPANAFAVASVTHAAPPVVTLSVTPLNGRYGSGSVTITGTGMPSIDGKTWPIVVTNSAQAKFTLTGADTSGETGTGAGGYATPA